MDEYILVKKRLVEADLLCATVELSDYATNGHPPVLNGHLQETPQVTLRRILRAVEPDYLSIGVRELWTRARGLGRDGKRITWEAMLTGASEEARNFSVWARFHGMAVAYQAVPAADRITAWAVCSQTIQESQQAVADATEQAQRVAFGVFGG